MTDDRLSCYYREKPWVDVIVPFPLCPPGCGYVRENGRPFPADEEARRAGYGCVFNQCEQLRAGGKSPGTGDKLLVPVRHGRTFNAKMTFILEQKFPGCLQEWSDAKIESLQRGFWMMCFNQTFGTKLVGNPES